MGLLILDSAPSGPVSGAGAVTLANMSGSSAGIVVIAAVASAVFEGMTGAAAGTVTHHARHAPFAFAPRRLGDVADVSLKQGDLEPTLSVTLVGVDGVVPPLVDAVGITFRLATTAGVEIFARAANLDDAAGGVLSYLWQAGDTVTAGSYYGEFVVDWGSGRTQTYPPNDYLLIRVVPKL